MKIINCKLKKSVQKKLLDFFVAEVTARTAANLLGIRPNSDILFYRKIREVIDYHLTLQTREMIEGEIEIDESYFGGEGKIKPDSIVYTDSYHSYDVLDVSEFKNFRINHSTHFAEDKNHINGIENFWNQAKRVLRKYNGINRKNFLFYLKECEISV